MKLENEEKCTYCREYGNLPCDECNKKSKKMFNSLKKEHPIPPMIQTIGILGFNYEKNNL